MKRYLVTGAAGFIGANFLKYLLKKYGEDVYVVVLDKLTYAGNLGTIKEEIADSRVRFVKGDIRNAELVAQIFAETDIDYVVNFAAESHVDRSIANPQLFLETNILGTQNMLDCARKAWYRGKDGEGRPVYAEGKKFLQVSTDEVYGSLSKDYAEPHPLEITDPDVRRVVSGRTDLHTYGKRFFTETTPLDPRSPYSASKTSADMFVRAYHETYGMPVNITRCSNNYGPYHFPEKLIPLIIKNILAGQKLPVYGKGDNVRDWLYVEDHAKAIDVVLERGRIGEVYNVGGFNEEQNINIVKLVIAIIARIMREEPELELTPNDSLGIVNKEFVLPTFEGVDISGDPITSENATVVLKNTDTDTTVSDIVDGIFTPTEAGNYEYSVTATDGDKSVTKTFVFYVSEAAGLHADTNGEAFVTTDGGSATYVENFAGKAALKLDMSIGQWPPVRVMPQRPMSDYEGYDTFVITFRVDSASFGEPGRTSRVVEVAGKAYRIPLDQWISLSRPISYFYENGNAVSKQFFAFWCDGESSDAHKNWPGCEPDTFSVYIAGMEAVKSGETLTENNLLDFSNIAVLDHFKDSVVDKWASSTHALYLPEVGGRQNVVGLYVSGTGMGWSFNLPESVNDYAFIEIDVYLTTTLADQYLVGHSNYALKETQKITSGEWTTIRISVSDYNSAQTAEGIHSKKLHR